jgi:hypothetical protein
LSGEPLLLKRKIVVAGVVSDGEDFAIAGAHARP